MGPIPFDRGMVLIGGAPVAHLESGSVHITNGKQNIVDLNVGYAGAAKGAVMATITAKRFVPVAGFAKGQDMHDAVLKHKFVTAMALTGGKKYVVTGMPGDIGRDWGVGAAASEGWAIDGGVEVTTL